MDDITKLNKFFKYIFLNRNEDGMDLGNLETQSLKPYVLLRFRIHFYYFIETLYEIIRSQEIPTKIDGYIQVQFSCHLLEEIGKWSVLPFHGYIF